MIRGDLRSWQRDYAERLWSLVVSLPPSFNLSNTKNTDSSSIDEQAINGQDGPRRYRPPHR